MSSWDAVVGSEGERMGLREEMVREVAQAVAARYAGGARGLGVGAQELRQETITAGLGCLEHEFRGSAYISTVCHNAAVRQLREERRHWENREDEFPLDLKLPGDIVTRIAFRSVIQSLKGELRKVMDLRLAGYSIERCSQALRLTLIDTKRLLAQLHEVFSEAAS